MYVGMIALQLRMILDFYQSTDILSANDPKQEIYLTVLVLLGVVLNSVFLSFMFVLYRTHINVISVVILIIGLNQRIYGYKNVSENIVNMIVNSFSVIVALPLFMFCN
jgi:hypothetical protein